MLAENPVERYFNEADRTPHPLESPVIVHVRRLVSGALKLKADLAKVESQLIKGIFEAGALQAFVGVRMSRGYEFLDGQKAIRS